MRIESALNASRQGLDAHGKAISVIGDNIANTNTVGFKGSRTEFADLLSTGESGTVPSSLPSTGSGVKVAQVRQLHRGGVVEFTGQTLDLAITGEGFFMVGDAEAPILTRAGNFSIDANGNLVNSEGKNVLGLSGEAGGVLGPINMSNLDLVGAATTDVALIGNLNAGSGVSALPENPATFLELGANASFASTVTTFDSLGAERNISLYFSKSEANTWTVNAYANGSDVGGEADVPVLIGTVELNFDTSGRNIGGTGATAPATIDITAEWDGAAPGVLGIDLSSMTQFSAGSNLNDVQVNGQATGSITGYQIDRDGLIFATLNTGKTVAVGTLQLANVVNKDGLERVGNAGFRETDRSGERTIGSAGALGLGDVEASSLERSTVDISQEFVELVLYQRGYQANSQLLNATNDILRDTIGLMR